MKHFVRYIMVSLLLFSAAGCRDELIQPETIGEGEARVSATLDFKPMATALARTRSAGNALKDITSLHVLLYNEEKSLIKSWKISESKYDISEKNRTDEDADNKHSAESSTKHVILELPEKIEFGRYYMYAVANLPDLLTNSAYANSIKSVDGLKNIPLAWDSQTMRENDQMLGYCTNTSAPQSEDEPLVINEKNVNLHAWLRRAASKVTVAFDASGLRDSISIYLKAVRIKNIPKYCKLGADNTVQATEEETNPNLIEKGEEVVYSESMDYNESYPALITKHLPYYPRILAEDGISWKQDPDRHSEYNPNSLFFYENLQGEGPDKTQQDENGDGVLDELYQYKDKPCATYIEVDAYYKSSNPERPGICNITYRFMLGQDVKNDYDAKRNCHYKLTLHFKGFADEPDWRIDYVTRLWATEPEVVDYRGKYFDRKAGEGIYSNYGNKFIGNNIITVTSFMYENDSWTNRKAQPYKIEYRDAGSTEFSETRPTWLDDFSKTDKGNGIHELKINYKNPYTSVPINDTLQQRPAKSGTYDLSTKGGTESMNTANCYIVDSKGTYQFPLVYGNAIVNGGRNETSYKYKAWGEGANYLRTFLNYKNLPIQSPYILQDIYGTTVPANLTASLVWQDEKDLVTNLAYISDPGAIRFDVNNPKEGNAVIALKDPSGTIMWSWHIWVTAMDLTKTLTLTNNEKHGSRQFEILPVNLGWCSGNIPVRYYERHECEVKFTQLINKGGESEEEGVSQIVKIVQEPHIALPCGNNPYYQHGRKDPFVASGGANNTNKQWYDASGNSSTSAPQTIKNPTPEPEYEAQRLETYKATALLIQNPDKWQNCPHEVNANPAIAGTYVPKDNIFFNLWDNSCWDDNDDVVKTVYDPCPVGYHVSSIYTFTGFTDYGESVSGDYSTNTYAVTEENMLNESDYKNNIVEFYTDKTKLISIGFLANGYRDWDDNAKVWQYGQGEVWCAQGALWSPLTLNGTTYYPNAYHLEFTRLTTGFTPHIFPWNNYYATDGMAVRPTRTLP